MLQPIFPPFPNALIGDPKFLNRIRKENEIIIHCWKDGEKKESAEVPLFFTYPENILPLCYT